MRPSRLFVFCSAVCAAFLSGCGVQPGTAIISGRVTDVDGQPVRNARVYTLTGETRTSASGSYTITRGPEGNVDVWAEITQGTTQFRGRNSVQSVQDGVQQSVNIVVFPTSQLARIRGTVRDIDGFPVAGARVFAYSDGYLSSASTSSDANGLYDLNDLGGGVSYTLTASAGGFQNDVRNNVTLSNGENRTINLRLDPRGTPSLPQVTGIDAITWVSPRNAARGGFSSAAAFENIKRRWNPNRPSQVGGRASSAGNPIEVELNWNRLVGADFYGYGIYRGTGTGAIVDYDFYREPMAGTYVDADNGLRPGTQYRYQMTALGTGFPQSANSEGPRSAIVTARTLNDLTASTSNPGNLRFSWNTNSGATSYVVYVFENFPGVDTSSIYNIESAPITGAFFDYNRTANPGGFISGRTYYYLVLGLANSNESRTLSQVGSFVY